MDKINKINLINTNNPIENNITTQTTFTKIKIGVGTNKTEVVIKITRIETETTNNHK